MSNLTTAEIAERYPLIKIVVPLSGGKDSQACLKLALTQHKPEEVIGLFCDTRWEHPITYAHLKTISELYGVYVQHICAGSVEGKIQRFKKFPSSKIRFCTSELKISPSRRFYESLAHALKHGFEVWYGMRAGESVDRASRYENTVSSECYKPHEINDSYPKKLGKLGVLFRLPLVDWSKQEVLDYVLLENLNPLYREGFDRVGCFPCLASGKQSQNNAFNFDLFGASQKQRVMQLEKAINKKHFPANTDQICLFCHV